MYSARLLGNYIYKLFQELNISKKELAKILNCKEYEVEQIFKGRKYLSYLQIEKLSKIFNKTVQELILGDPSYYNLTIVHYVNNFSNFKNREFILDIIDDYVDIKDSLK